MNRHYGYVHVLGKTIGRKRVCKKVETGDNGLCFELCMMKGKGHDHVSQNAYIIVWKYECNKDNIASSSIPAYSSSLLPESIQYIHLVARLDNGLPRMSGDYYVLCIWKILSWNAVAIQMSISFCNFSFILTWLKFCHDFKRNLLVLVLLVARHYGSSLNNQSEARNVCQQTYQLKAHRNCSVRLMWRVQ